VEQLQVLGRSVGALVYTAAPGETAPQLAKRARREALQAGFDALIVDTAGRLAVDEALMAELKAVKAAAQPHEILLVLDAMQGQDALPTATRFHEAVGVDGLVLTKLDGDARGGAALSALAVTGKPVKFLGTGEKTEALEPFHPDRLAGRILGMGDVVGLVERVQTQVDVEQAARLAKKAGKQGLDLQDLLEQLQQLRKMGSLKDLAAMVPGGAQLGDAAMDEGRLKRSIAVLQSMSARERRRPEIIHGERRKRIAKGSGTRVEDVNQVLRTHEQMKKMMKRMSQGGRRRGGFGMPGGRGIPGMPGF
jgi:signal recognition particle subunit SRP54